VAISLELWHLENDNKCGVRVETKGGTEEKENREGNEKKTK
jgi:hypothetical protein